MANVEDAKDRVVRWTVAGCVYLLPNWIPSLAGSSWSPIYARNAYYCSPKPKEKWEKGCEAMTPSEDAQGRLGRSKAAGEVPLTS